MQKIVSLKSETTLVDLFDKFQAAGVSPGTVHDCASSLPTLDTHNNHSTSTQNRRKSVTFSMRIQTIPPSSYSPDDDDESSDDEPDEPLIVHSKDMRNSFFMQDFSITKPCYRMTQQELDALLGPASASSTAAV
ncbi:hypothetical protein HDU77_006327 [Chytriomyces hyalinus]|nr:hypothetical protein HDU77_006327 [Chytriomyces hyalinus]